MKYTNKLKPATRADSAQMLRMLNGSGVVQRTTMSNEIIRIYFTDEGIGGSSQHLEELEAINSASLGDTIIVHVVGCPGGDGSTTMAFLNALMSTPAHTVCIIEGHNASAASIIPMGCAEVIATPYCSLMCHTGHGGEYGTIMNKARSANFGEKLYHSWLADVYDGFLDEDELKMIFDGLEIYLDSEQIEERLKKRAELMAAEAEEECDCEECSLDEEIVSSVVESMEELKEHGSATEDEVEEVKAIKKKAPVRTKGVIHNPEVIAVVEPPPAKKKASPKKAKAFNENDDPDFEKSKAPSRPPKVTK